MTREDYCSFELSKLLKEKGFDVSWCDRGWDISCYDVKQSRMFSHGYDNKDNWIEQPTFSLAMKWLREKDIDIIIMPLFKFKGGRIYCYEIHSDNTDVREGRFDTYEEAVEAALKYTLENLI